jgi:hypothetical protein
MPIDLSKFTNIDKRDGVAVYERSVETPMPENEDGSGYTTEKNIQTAYRAGRHIIKVSKVSDRGWSVWRYVEGDDGIKIGESYARGINGQQAQRLGLMEASKLAA